MNKLHKKILINMNFEEQKLGDLLLVFPVKNKKPLLENTCYLEGICIDMWDQIKNENSLINIFNKFYNEYDVKRERLEKDLFKLINVLNEVELIKLVEVL